MSIQSQHHKLQTLESVRALAALSVVAFHASYQSYLHGYAAECNSILNFGKHGVQVFFVLSGFIILFIHGKDFGNLEQTPRYFYRRWLRIWPLYAALTLIQVVGKPFIPGKDIDSANQIITSLLFLDLTNTPIITVGWTLIHEAFFYLIFGFILIFGKRLAAWFGIGFIICMIAHNFDSSAVNPLVSFTFSHHKWYFLTGIAVACWVPGRASASREVSNEQKKLGFLIFIIILILGIYSIIYPMHGKVRPKTMFLALGIGLALLGIVRLDLARTLEMPKILVYLGAASYSIYLVHSTVLDFGIIILGKLVPGAMASYLGLIMTILSAFSVICGVICHEFLEKPLIQYIRKLRTKRLNTM
ncbi:MAG: acyltransferase family protein [Akkermansiaceae bacterium]